MLMAKFRRSLVCLAISNQKDQLSILPTISLSLPLTNVSVLGHSVGVMQCYNFQLRMQVSTSQVVCVE